jgi:hypothetical protein
LPAIAVVFPAQPAAQPPAANPRYGGAPPQGQPPYAQQAQYPQAQSYPQGQPPYAPQGQSPVPHGAHAQPSAGAAPSGRKSSKALWIGIGGGVAVAGIIVAVVVATRGGGTSAGFE